MTAEEYRNLLDTDLEDIDIDDLTDISTLQIDESLSWEERVLQYIKQTKTPKRVKKDKTKISVAFANNGIKFDDAFIGMLLVV